MSEWIVCWQCGGDGGYHNCGESSCCCLDSEEITMRCDICRGQGGWNSGEMLIGGQPGTEESP